MYNGAVLRRLRHPTSGKQKQPEHCKPAHPPPNHEVFVCFGLLIILHVPCHILFEAVQPSVLVPLRLHTISCCILASHWCNKYTQLSTLFVTHLNPFQAITHLQLAFIHRHSIHTPLQTSLLWPLQTHF